MKKTTTKHYCDLCLTEYPGSKLVRMVNDSELCVSCLDTLVYYMRQKRFVVFPQDCATCAGDGFIEELVEVGPYDRPAKRKVKCRLCGPLIVKD